MTRCVAVFKAGLDVESATQHEQAQMSVKACVYTANTSNTYLAVDSTMEPDDVGHKRHAAIYY